MHIHDCPGARVSLDVDTDDCDGKNAFPKIQDLLRQPGNQSRHDDPFERACDDGRHGSARDTVIPAAEESNMFANMESNLPIV